MPLNFRPARLDDGDDRDFILGTWLDSYRTSHAAGLIQMDSWDEAMAPQLLAVLARPGVTVLLAEHPDEERPHNFYGWVAVERSFAAPAYLLHPGAGSVCVEAHRPREVIPADRPLVHYVYVKSGYREQGLARALFRRAGIDPADPFLFTCKTGWVTTLGKKAPGGKWAPLIARFPKDPNGR